MNKNELVTYLLNEIEENREKSLTSCIKTLINFGVYWEDIVEIMGKVSEKLIQKV